MQDGAVPPLPSPPPSPAQAYPDETGEGKKWEEGREDIGRRSVQRRREKMAQVRGFFLYMYFNLVYSVVLNWFVQVASAIPSCTK